MILFTYIYTLRFNECLYIPLSHYRQLEVDLLKQKMDRTFYEMKAAQSKFQGLQKVNI